MPISYNLLQKYINIVDKKNVVKIVVKWPLGLWCNSVNIPSQHQPNDWIVNWHPDEMTQLQNYLDHLKQPNLISVVHDLFPLIGWLTNGNPLTFL